MPCGDDPVKPEPATIGRRDFMVLAGGGLAAGTLAGLRAAVAQSAELPVIGFLHTATVESYVSNAGAFARGLKEMGFVEAGNFAVEYRFANGEVDRLAALAADLAQRPVALIVAAGGAAALAAKAAAPAVPIVIVSGVTPDRLGLAAEASGVTGATFATAGLAGRRLALLRRLAPGAGTIGYLAEDAAVYGRGSRLAQVVADMKNEVTAAADGLEIAVAEIGRDRDRGYEAAFASFGERHVGALMIAPSAVFAGDAEEIVALTLRDAIPAIFTRRADVVAGGLIGYGASPADAWQQAGARVGAILKGARPAGPPVIETARLELVINLPIARTLGVMVPSDLMAQADELIR